MPIERGGDIARRALDLVGVPFKLHGRTPDSGLDCVGVVALAAGKISVEAPCDYALRGNYLGRATAALDSLGFCTINGEPICAGDILLCQVSDRQLHFTIATGDGFVHAHAGLRRVVLTPPPLPWPIIGHWRSTGD